MLGRPGGIVQLVEQGRRPLVRGRRSVVGVRRLAQSGASPAPKRFPDLGPIRAPLHVRSLPRTTPGQTPLMPPEQEERAYVLWSRWTKARLRRVAGNRRQWPKLAP